MQRHLIGRTFPFREHRNLAEVIRTEELERELAEAKAQRRPGVEVSAISKRYQRLKCREVLPPEPPEPEAA